MIMRRMLPSFAVRPEFNMRWKLQEKLGHAYHWQREWVCQNRPIPFRCISSTQRRYNLLLYKHQGKSGTTQAITHERHILGKRSIPRALYPSNKNGLEILCSASTTFFLFSFSTSTAVSLKLHSLRNFHMKFSSNSCFQLFCNGVPVIKSGTWEMRVERSANLHLWLDVLHWWQ